MNQDSTISNMTQVKGVSAVRRKHEDSWANLKSGHHRLGLCLRVSKEKLAMTTAESKHSPLYSAVYQDQSGHVFVSLHCELRPPHLFSGSGTTMTSGFLRAHHRQCALDLREILVPDCTKRT